jgi:hypothetical protein
MAGNVATTPADGTIGSTAREPSGTDGILIVRQQSSARRPSEASGQPERWVLSCAQGSVAERPMASQ